MIREKSKSLSTLIKDADEVVSIYVRLNAADDRGNIKCISCGEKVYWKQADCCHYKDRDNMATRFYLPNLAPGCVHCNRFNHFEHIAEWSKWFTDEEKADLEVRSHSMMKYTRNELEELILDFKEKVTQLKKLKL